MKIGKRKQYPKVAEASDGKIKTLVDNSAQTEETRKNHKIDH